MLPRIIFNIVVLVVDKQMPECLADFEGRTRFRMHIRTQREDDSTEENVNEKKLYTKRQSGKCG